MSLRDRSAHGVGLWPVPGLADGARVTLHLPGEPPVTARVQRREDGVGLVLEAAREQAA